MKTDIQKVTNSQTEIKIEVEAQDFRGFVDKAVLELGKDLEVEGFRKGHVPKEIIEKHLGKDKILQQAAQDCIRENYVRAIKENKLEPLGQPQIEILKLVLGNPFEFKAAIQVLPEIKLPDYKKLVSQIKRKEAKVSQEEIDKLKQEKERVEKERLRGEILEKIAEKSQIEVPQILLDAEKNRMLQGLKQQVPQMLQVTFEDYLKKIGKNEEELLGSFSREAETRVKNSLVLREIEKKENPQVNEEEVKAEMEKISKINPNLDQAQLKEYTESVIKNEKTLQILESLIKT